MRGKLTINLDEVSSNSEEAILDLISWGIRYCEIRMVNGKNIAYLTKNESFNLQSKLKLVDLHSNLITSPIFKWNFSNGNKELNLREIDMFGV